MSKKQQMFRRVLTFILAAILALGFLSTLAFAVGAETIDEAETAAFITQPTDAAAPSGTSVKVTVKATGDGLKYAWYHQQKGKTSFTKSKSLTSNYFSVKMASAWDGAKIRCIITDQYGNVVKSDIVTIYMGNPAKITTQPKNTTVVVGKTASISVKATGDGLTYTWYHKNAGAAKYSKSSITKNTYSAKMTEAMDGRSVYCVVTDKYGTSVTSSVVTIKKAIAAKITTQPKNTVAENGKTAKVTIKATGDGLTYTWYYAKKGSSKFTKVSGSSATYSVKMSSSVNGRKVYCVVTDKYGTTVKTSTVTLTMGKFAKITTQPKNTTVVVGKTASISVKATGDGLTYTWYHKNAGAAKYSKSSITKNTYSAKMTEAMDGRSVYCVVTDKYGNTVKSSVVTIQKANTAKITTQPKSVAVENGKTAKVTIKATGDGLKYTWYYAKKGSSKFTKLSTTSATYSLKMSSSNNGRQVYCVVKDKYGTSVKSNVVTLSVRNYAKITTQPKSTVVIVGKTASISVKASGDGLTYTWYHKDAGAAKYSKSSITKNEYTTKMTEAKDGRQVYCVVTDKYGNSVKSSVVTITKANLATITTQPKNATAPSGSTAKVTVKATGDGLTYTWYYAKKGSSKYSKLSCTSATYSVKMSSSVNGRKVYCVVKDKYGNSVKSSAVTLYMGNPVKITTQPKNVTGTPYQVVKVSVKASGDGLKYVWYGKSATATKYKKTSVTTAAYSVEMCDDVNGYMVYCVITDKYGNTAQSKTVTLKQRQFTDEELMSPYVQPLIDDIAAATKAHMKEDSLCFVLYTDTHYQKKDTLFQTVIAKHLAEATNANAIVNLGDLAYMMEDDRTTGLGIYRRHTDILQDCKVPYLQVVGKADDGHLHPHYITKDFSAENYVKPSEVFEATMGRLQSDIVLGSKDGWYYMDDETSKTRMIILNSHNFPWIVKEDGTLAYDSDYKTGIEGIYSTEQIEWLANTALNFSDKGNVEEQAKWSVLAFAHMGTGSWAPVNCLFTAFREGQKVSDFSQCGGDIYGLYDYSGIKITSDFSLMGPRKIAFFCSNQSDDEVVDNGYPIFNFLESKYDSEMLGTPNETAITVVVVTPSEGKITELRFGEGTKIVNGKEVPIDPLKDYDNYRVINY